MQQQNQSLIATMANQYGIEPSRFRDSLVKSVIKQNIANEDLMAFCVVANKYGLNPFTREIYAFPARGGGFSVIVGIDGWLSIINNHPQYDGMEISVADDGSQATCVIHRKDRNHPTVVTEYLAECQQPTQPWKQFPRRMLRHKAIIQCARAAFGITGISDEEDGKTIAAEDPRAVSAKVVQPPIVNPFPELPAEDTAQVEDTEAVEAEEFIWEETSDHEK